MTINEAKQILNNNGYELIEESKLGRALGIGALALGSLVGNANAHNYTHNYRDDSIEDIIEYKNKIEDIYSLDKIALKDAGFIRKAYGITTILPIKSLKKINISDDVTEISFYDYGNEDGYTINIYFENGTTKTITYSVFEKSQMTIEDEYDNVISRKYLSNSKAKNMIDKYYKDIMKEFKKDFDETSYNEEVNNYNSNYNLSDEDSNKIDNYNEESNEESNEDDSNNYKKNKDEYTPEQWERIKQIMAKYQ